MFGDSFMPAITGVANPKEENAPAYVWGLCHCDHDCLPYRGYIEQSGPASFFRAEYICQMDWDACTGSKECMSQCQFGAQFYSSALGKVYIDPKRCFDCGVCRAACPHDAIAALPRRAHPDAANVWLSVASVNLGG